MNQTEITFLQAIQKSVWRKDVSFPADTDWSAIFKEAEDHTVLGFVFDAAPADMQQEWKKKASRITANFVRILHCQEQLYLLLKANDIPMAILKGTAAAVYYPNPSLRSMGDIDYIVPAEDFDKAKALLVANGYMIEEDPEALRHLHVYQDGIRYEQHWRFSGVGIDIERYVTDGLAHAEIETMYGTEFPMLPRLVNGLVLLGHMAQHLNRRGLGLRQVIDWMMYADHELDDEFWDLSFAEAARESGLETLAVVVTKMCQLYLGLTEEIHWCDTGDANLCSALIDYLLSSGNFGRKQGERAVAAKAVSNMFQKGFFRYLQEAGRINWKACQKHTWLKPFAWIYQLCRYAKRGLRAKRSGNELIQDIERGKLRSYLLDKLEIGQK